MNKRLQRLGIGRRMLVLLLGVSLVPIIFVLLISYRQSASTITRQTGELIEANLEQSSGNVQNFLDTFENLIQDIYTDQTYVDNLKPINIWVAVRRPYQSEFFKFQIDRRNRQWVKSIQIVKKTSTIHTP